MKKKNVLIITVNRVPELVNSVIMDDILEYTGFPWFSQRIPEIIPRITKTVDHRGTVF
jgi:hypothetical protein